MDQLERELTRRHFLKAAGAAAAVVGIGGVAAACSTGSSAAPSAAASAGAAASAASTPAASFPMVAGNFNWMTWSDHWYQDQLDQIAKTYQITTNITELADNADGFTKLKEVGGQLDMISGDALWVPKYYEAGLIEAWDLNELPVSAQLFPVAREFKIWTTPAGYLGYPFGWSPVQIYYNPAYVKPAPDSWEVLLDPKYVKRVVVENQPTDNVAYMGKANGVANPYDMTPEELAKAKESLKLLKPNILKLSQQNTETVSALASGEAWLSIGYLGMDERVKDAGGPLVIPFIPKEGTVGWMDSEMIVKGGGNTQATKPFLQVAEQAPYMAQNFLKNGRPLFNEDAYKLLVNQGQQERADRYLYNKPETVLSMTLKGPGASTQGAIDIWNEVFGA
jgi:spermidine/putrescine-binding protein